MDEHAELQSQSDHPLLAYEAPALVLLDKVQLGFDLLLPNTEVSQVGRLTASLARLGVLRRRPKTGTALNTELVLGNFSVPLSEGGQGSVGGELWLAAGSSGRLVVTRRSRLVLNPLRDLRTQLARPGEKALDGNDNLVWEFGEEWRHLLGLQLANLTLMMDAFLSAVATAAETAPELLRGRVWVQQCEVCRDYSVPGAEAVVRELKDRPMPGAVVGALRTVVVRRRNLLCVAWREGAANSPESKVYAKRDDLVRVEISVRSRPAVRSLLARRETVGELYADINGAAIGLLLLTVACTMFARTE